MGLHSGQESATTFYRPRRRAEEHGRLHRKKLGIAISWDCPWDKRVEILSKFYKTDPRKVFSVLADLETTLMHGPDYALTNGSIRTFEITSKILKVETLFTKRLLDLGLSLSHARDLQGSLIREMANDLASDPTDKKQIMAILDSLIQKHSARIATGSGRMIWEPFFSGASAQQVNV